ncbi:hypothetical protein PWT90_06681 [Aphanocladium album]|nr:hypothetical protein PWT90_06681 [Aphanocladium album]
MRPYARGKASQFDGQRKDAHDGRVAQPPQRQHVEHQHQHGAHALPRRRVPHAREQQVQRVGKEDDQRHAGGQQLEGEEGRDDDAGARAVRHVRQVRVGDEGDVVAHAAGQQVGRVRRHGRREGQDAQAQDPAAHAQRQRQAEHADADDGVDGVER